MGLIPQFLPPQPRFINEAADRAVRTQRTIRAITGYGTSGVDVTGGAFCSITDFRKDFDDTNITALDYATVSGNLITLTRPGYYLITYHAALSIELTQAATVNPATTVGKTVLKCGGQEMPGTEGYVTMTEFPRLDGFIQNTTEDPYEVKTNISGATGKTDPFQVDSFALEGGGAASAILEATLDGSLQQALTLDTQDAIDATTNGAQIESYTPEDFVRLTTSGTALIEVVLDSSGDLKIRFPGPSDVNPILDVFASGGDSREVVNSATSLSITRLS